MNGDPGQFVTGEIWRGRPRPISALGGYVGAAGRGAGWGLGIGMMAGTAGIIPGVAIGVTIGVVIKTLTAGAERLNQTWRMLERVSRTLIERFKDFSPAIARMRAQWEALDRRLGRVWAQTITPLLQRISDVGREMKERWMMIKVRFFEAIQPLLIGIVNMAGRLSRVLFPILEFFAKLLEKILAPLNKLFELLGLIEKPKVKISPLPGPLTMPEFEGPMTAAMRFAPLRPMERPEGPRYVERPGYLGREWLERRERAAAEAGRTPGERLMEMEEEIEKEGMPWTTWGWLIRYFMQRTMKQEIERRTKELEKPTSINVNVNVGDSAELASAFERVWEEATFELRKIEAGDMYRSFRIRERATYG